MSKIIDSIRIPVQVTVASNSTGTIATDKVRQGEALVIQSVAFRNRSDQGITSPLQPEHF